MRTRTARRQHARATNQRFDRLPGSRRPFARAIELHQKFIDTLAAHADSLPIDRKIAVDELPAYVSRGHGGRYRPTQRLIGGAWSQDRSRYSPADDTGPGRARRDRRKHEVREPGYDVAELHAFADAIRARVPMREARA